MANQTAPTDRKRSQGVIQAYLAGAVDLFAGSLVTIVTSTGFAKGGADLATEKFVGVLDKTVKNSTGAAGAKDARVWKSGIFAFGTNFTPVQADIGATVSVVDNSTVAKTTTNSVTVGVIAEVLNPGVANSAVRVIIKPTI